LATEPVLEVSVDDVMRDLNGRVRERLRTDLLRHGASPAFNDPALFADVPFDGRPPRAIRVVRRRYTFRNGGWERGPERPW
jgi:hypothetical protein